MSESDHVRPKSDDGEWRLPVCVVMSRKPMRHGKWLWQSWKAEAVLAGQGLQQSAGRVTMDDTEGAETALYTGFEIELFKDSAGDYWYNLISESPSLYVICHEDADDTEMLVPVLVTATHDEAAAHVETDDPVFTVPMPPTVHQWLERYVLENYVPSEPRKRKRI